MNAFYVDPDIKKASTIPSSFYTSQDWFEQSKEKIFAKTWQFCLSTEELRLSNQLFPYTLLPGFLDEPLLFARDEQNMLRCLSNVCTHRGNILIETPCSASKIKCSYHGRRFDLRGEFLHMPEFEGVHNFPCPKDNLSQIPFDSLEPFLFASLCPQMSFAEVFAEIKERLYWLPMSDMRLDSNRSRDYLVKAHWALYCENYLEPLHIPFVHPGLRKAIDCTTYTTEISRYCNLQLALASPGEEHFDLPKDSPDYGKQVAAYYYWIFPNTMLNFYPWGCSVNVVKPLAPNLTKVSFLTYVLDETKLDRGAGGDLDLVEREDEAVVESVQKGIRSRFYDQGRFSPSKEPGTHHFQRLLCEFLNN
ncbi:SRPBCC family protein [Legionella jordanis]|uniref:Choline monooxygenase n=1 Tax=Legionella jordanis TaxID=456 RepID=A0A0W0VCU3_9GAMM|nr:SRPBCC family protein [Legionella jordanis]KTD17433.1 choline monooxygenase [Legionella jordanis]RMX01803.1 aromatic ring-hydroxylating dioxygenase subunit alpha [Legionella jordanis]RMX15467.1 aromatic ring-hydroxylating dioxygenase subunit alpha [Legionella jordanis]VEH11545.1 choline monooxygenase [Legionella jordanis]HAT8714620.1 Rieske 2Fe-2S domain-containing protein [Legionella jordanis]